MMTRLIASFLLFFSANCALAKSVAVAVSPEGREYHTGLRKLPANLKGLGKTTVSVDDCGTLPADFDLRDLGVVPPVRDQGQCGSCWAFSKTASLESAVLSGSGSPLDLAEQELVSCDKQNYGCDGGNLTQNEYQVSHGQGLEKDFPYRAQDVSCKAVTAAAKGISFVNVPANDKQVQCALFKSHTIPWITVSAGNDWGSFPSTLKPITSCGNRGTNHAVGIVGWKTIGDKVYYIMRNSWGSSWGAEGYALMALGCDELGDEVAYIQTKAEPCAPPTPKLPIEITAAPGDALELAVTKQAGVKYSWYRADKKIGTGGSVAIVADAPDVIYSVKAKNACGNGESTTRVKTVAP